MTLGTLTVKKTKHLLGVFSTVATPNPSDANALVNAGFPLREKTGDVAVLVPASELGAQPASDPSPARVADALVQPQQYYYDDDAKEFARITATGTITVTSTTISVPKPSGSVTPQTLKFVIAVQDKPLPGNAATVFSDSVVADGTAYVMKNTLPAGKMVVFVEGFLPFVQ